MRNALVKIVRELHIPSIEQRFNAAPGQAGCVAGQPEEVLDGAASSPPCARRIGPLAKFSLARFMLNIEREKDNIDQQLVEEARKCLLIVRPLKVSLDKGDK